MFDINVFSALALTQLVIPVMRRQGTGVIVNIGSVGGKVSLPWAVMYCATKWALHCVDDSLRENSGVPGYGNEGFTGYCRYEVSRSRASR